jgi:hypothetical protein
LLAAPLARIAQLQQGGEIAAALSDLNRLEASNDNRVTSLARSVAQSAYRVMEAALAAATGQDAAKLASASFTAAAQAHSLADAALSRNDFVLSGTRALDAAAAYRKAESDARNAAAALAAKTPPPAAAPGTPAATPTTVPRPSAFDSERSGILQALTRYQEAFRNRSVKDLQAIYPSIPRETRQAIERQFTRDCGGYDVTYGNLQLAPVADDPTAATVTVRTTYTCQPRTGQGGQPNTVQDIFALRKVGGAWLIDNMGVMDTAKRR